MDERQILAQLLMRGQGQGMGDGNPTADYLGQRSEGYGQEARDDMLKAAAHGTVAVGAFPEMLPASVLFGLLSGGHALSGLYNTGMKGFTKDGSDMWANRFGSGDPAQGMPGTPAGPAWRR